MYSAFWPIMRSACPAVVATSSARRGEPAWWWFGQESVGARACQDMQEGLAPGWVWGVPGHAARGTSSNQRTLRAAQERGSCCQLPNRQRSQRHAPDAAFSSSCTRAIAFCRSAAEGSGREVLPGKAAVAASVSRARLAAR